MKMRVRRRIKRRLRRLPGFGVSALVHLAAFVTMFLIPSAPRSDRPIYEQQIRPNESHIIWYNLRTKLPEVKPAEDANAKQPRALRRFTEQIVAGKIDLPRPPQLIRVPAPEIALPEALKMPNMLAAAPRKPVRQFAPPPDPAKAAEPRPLPAAPQVKNAAVSPDLALNLAAPRPRPLPFTAPTPRKTEPALTALPAAPVVAVPVPTGAMPRIPRGFSAPPEKKSKPAAEPVLATDGAPVSVAPSTQTTLAVVGLAPVDTPEIPKPPGAHETGFSAGPHPRPESGPASPPAAALTVPNLTAHGGSQEANAAVLAVMRPLTRERITAEMLAGSAAAQQAAPVDGARLVKAPDPRFDGRAVYTISIQMPNVTSFSGSWIVWFAERRPLDGASLHTGLASPVPLRKVDPKYFREAIYDRVEGTVRLFAVIRKDGQVDAIEVLHGVDSRLDRSAADALSKWQFEPAKRNGVPVEVDAIFEVPFRLAPKSEKLSQR